MARVGLVLGAGGSVGLAYHGGVLAALEDVTGWDPRSAEVMVGTSAGSLSSALLRIGLPAGDLRAVSEGRPLTEEGAALADLGRPHRPRHRVSHFLRPRPLAAPMAVGRAWLRGTPPSPMALAAALLPAGPVPTMAISSGLDRVSGDSWPEGLWICAVRLGDGRRVVFGREGSPTTTLGRAVGASCAVPAFFRPVRIGDRRYVDGGVASIDNADLLAPLDLDLVVVSAPMAHAGARPGIAADSLLRLGVRAQLEAELRKLRRRGTEVLTLLPNRRVQAAMGLDAMDARKRRLVSRVAYGAAVEQLAGSASSDLLAEAARDERSEAPPAA